MSGRIFAILGLPGDRALPGWGDVTVCYRNIFRRFRALHLPRATSRTTRAKVLSLGNTLSLHPSNRSGNVVGPSGQRTAAGRPDKKGGSRIRRRLSSSFCVFAFFLESPAGGLTGR